MLGVNIRVGLEDTMWRYPNSDQQFSSNLEMFQNAKTIAELHGRLNRVRSKRAGSPISAEIGSSRSRSGCATTEYTDPYLRQFPPPTTSPIAIVLFRSSYLHRI
jgi:hypothetical protein